MVYVVNCNPLHTYCTSITSTSTRNKQVIIIIVDVIYQAIIYSPKTIWNEELDVEVGAFISKMYHLYY